jgi:hypothetical protein
VERVYKHFSFLTGFLLLLLLAITLPACSVLGYGDTNIDTVRKAAIVADAEIRAGYLLLESLIANRTIDADSARSVKDKLDDARNGVRVTFSVVRAGGDPVAGDDLLTRALNALEIAMTIMAEIEQPPD